MFTGIVEDLGTVKSILERDDSESGGKGYSMTVEVSETLPASGDGGESLLDDVHLGDSISVNGTCLTVTEYGGQEGGSPPAWFKAGSRVNLERAMQGHTRMGGHFVQGHVDGVVRITSKQADGNSLRLKFAPLVDHDAKHGAMTASQAQEMMSLVIEKGYVALDGTSLTVTEVSPAGAPIEQAYFGVMLIAYTQAHIVLPSKEVGDRVNLEVDMIGKLSLNAANALVYSSLVGFMFVGLFAGLYVRNKRDYLSGLGTQSALPLAMNWFASNMSSSVLFSYPQLGTIAGIMGVAVYAFATVAPLWLFAALAPVLRRKCPAGFTLTEFFLERYGRLANAFLSLVFVCFMLLYMVAELNTYGSVVNLLGNVDPTIAALIVAITTTIYSWFGGFKASLWTDNVQGIVIVIFIIIGGVAMGTQIQIQDQYKDQYDLITPTKLGGELWYILPVAVVFAQCFNQGFWQRAFSSKNDKTLYLSTFYSTLLLFPVIFLIGFTGIIATWSGLFQDTPDADGSESFFLIMAQLPDWVNGIVLVLASALSCSAYDTLQSALVSTISNDLFANRVPLFWTRLVVLCLNVPAVVLAVKNVNILQVFLIGDLIASAFLPPPLLGIIDRLFFLNWIDVIAGGFGGLFCVFIFGTIYYSDAQMGISLLILPNGLYVTSDDDYSVLGAFLAAPFGALLVTGLVCALRALVAYVLAKRSGREFTFFKGSAYDGRKYASAAERVEADVKAAEEEDEEGDSEGLGQSTFWGVPLPRLHLVGDQDLKSFTWSDLKTAIFGDFAWNRRAPSTSTSTTLEELSEADESADKNV